MKGCNALLIVIAGIALCPGICDGDDSSSFQLKIRPSGFASMEIGEIVKGGVNSKTNESMDNIWMKQVIAGLSVNASLSQKSSLAIGMEMQMYNDFPITLEKQPPQYRYIYFYPYLSRAEFTHAFGNIENPYLTLSAGYFPFKYNRDVRNLGEYLFRTGAYPQYILNGFDIPCARLMGAHAGYTPLPNLKIDAVFYTNLQWYAVGDWNLAAIASYTIADCIDVGLGGSLNSIISPDSNLTTPHDSRTLYHISLSRDSSFFTFKGAKLMARASVDFKKFIPGEFFGKEDLRLYGEAAILGLRDYPGNVGDISYDTILKKNTYSGKISYDDILERIPVMFGFTIPTLNFLDVLSAEVEYFRSPYPNDVGALTQFGVPLPGSILEDGKKDYRSMRMYKDDDWKWSIYGTKTFAKYYAVTLQVANDHLRSLAVNDQFVDFEETLHNLNHWYYMLKAKVFF